MERREVRKWETFVTEAQAEGYWWRVAQQQTIGVNIYKDYDGISIERHCGSGASSKMERPFGWRFFLCKMGFNTLDSNLPM